MEVRCPNCKKVFNPNNEQEKFLMYAIEKKQVLAMIECAECYKDVPINPMNLMSFEPKKDKVSTDEYDGKSCPVCKEGILSFIDHEKEKFWGCGECGNVWFSKQDLEKEF